MFVKNINLYFKRNKIFIKNLISFGYNHTVSFYEGEKMKKVFIGICAGIVVLVAGCTPLETALAQTLFNSVFGL